MVNSLAGKKLLIVEDEELLAMAVEDGVLYAGAASVEIAGTVNQALDLLSGHSFDLAIVDVSLKGQHSWPVAEELRRRNVPYLTVTGYGDMLDHELVTKLLTKPYSIDGLLEALADLQTHAPTSPTPANPGPQR
ncbi:response regulator [Lysobacter capsici]|uniref:response regulator n=1 Tax=Lysobacter capsici TaxID=435897 RepID=UPI001C001389|nr:response regulator [Lysobacter capsici]MBW8808104.1 response regulator [Lysobacter sp.]QWF17040.1 response regulator [Lysobacter capsici]